MKTPATQEAKPFKIAGAVALTLLTTACATPLAPQPEKVALQAGTGVASRMDRLLRYCETLYNSGDIRTAAGMCMRAHELDPSDPAAMLKLGEMFSQTDHNEDAVRAYKTVLTRYPMHPEALYALGRAYLNLGREDDALQAFETAAASDPQNWRVHNAIGVLKAKRGDHDAARKHYEVALDIDPGNLSVQSNLGLSLALTGQKKEALAILNNVVASPEASSVAYHNLQIAQAVPDPETTAEMSKGSEAAIEKVELSHAEQNGKPAEARRGGYLAAGPVTLMPKRKPGVAAMTKAAREPDQIAAREPVVVPAERSEPAMTVALMSPDAVLSREPVAIAVMQSSTEAEPAASPEGWIQLVALSDPSIQPMAAIAQVSFRGHY